MMQIVKDYPPNFDQLSQCFDIHGRCVFFAWGTRIYNPSGVKIEPALIVHETIHGERQGKDIEGWWQRYIDEPKFRLAEEIPAHMAEYKARMSGATNRQIRRSALKLVASRLSGPMYGNLISRREAMSILTGAA